MNNWNVGVDLVEIERFEQLPYSKHAHFYERVFTHNEIEYSLKSKFPAKHFAGTFAAKEAGFKAMNEFFPINLNDLEILRSESKLPNIRLKNSHKSNIDNHLIRYEGVNYTIRVSISHSRTHAIAVAIVSIGKSLPIGAQEIGEMINKYDF